MTVGRSIVGRSTYGSAGVARYRVVTAELALGADHPATRAATGRWLARRGNVTQLGATTIEAVAWHRESGADPGYMNRTARKRKPC